MFLSRSGLELTEIWAKQAALVEMDANLRQLERGLAATGSHEDWVRHTTARLRAGESAEEMAHKIGRSYLAADKLLERARVNHQKHSKLPPEKQTKRGASAYARAQEVHQSHADRLHHISERTGRSAGIYVPTKPIAHPNYELSQHEHILALARLHRHHEEGGLGTELGSHGESHFKKPSDARDFRAAMHHHYPDAGTTSRDTYDRRTKGLEHGLTRVAWRSLP